MNFTVGSAVEITTRFKSNYFWDEYDTNVVKGKVVPNPKWLSGDSISVHTGNSNYPVSYIHKSMIVGYEQSETSTSNRVFKVSSKSSNKSYLVSLIDGRVTCNCIGFEYRRYCKHSNKVKEMLDKQNI